MKHTYTVTVGNVGNIDCPTLKDAQRTYAEYVRQSKYGSGRASGEAVALCADGEPLREYFPPESIADLYTRDPLKACRRALRETRELPDTDRLEAVNALLEMHGTEAIRGEWQNGYWCDIVAAYCNTGDTYDLTVIQVRGDRDGAPDRFIVSSFGDWVEKNTRRYSLA